MSEGVFPIITVISPANPVAGSQVTITVTTNIATKDNQVVAVTSSPSGFFSNIPSQVTLLSGNNQVQFSATLASSASGDGSATAACNGQQAEGTCSVGIA